MPAPATSRQTISFLMKRFAEVGIRPHHKHGQNFLIDLNLQQLLVDSAELSQRDVVLEIGTGTGALTALMAPCAAAVVTVEIDRHLYQLASEELFGVPNVTMLAHDALRNKNSIDSQVWQAVQQKMEEGPGRQLKLVANLPYSIATPVLTNLLAGPIVPVFMTATIQKELADRIIARPGTKAYGALSIWMQSQCQVHVVRNLPPTVFWPRPKVTSSIIHAVIDPELRARITDLAFFQSFTRAMFFHRRKFLRSELASFDKERLPKDAVDRILGELQLDPESRAEQLSVEEMLALADRVREHLQAPSPTG